MRRTTTKTLAALAVFMAFWGCQTRNTRVPDELIGIWRTADQKYSDRFFQITENTIVFATGDKSSDVYTIKAVEERTEKNELVYAITYAGEDGYEYTLSLLFDSAKRNAIRFKNQNHIVWIKESHKPGA